MDPFSDSGELYSIHNLYYKGSYDQVIDTSIDTFSEEFLLPASIYIYRAKIALGESRKVIDELKEKYNVKDGSELEHPSLRALWAFAIITDENSSEEEKKGAIELVTDLSSDKKAFSDPITVYLSGCTLFLGDHVEEALKIASTNDQSLEVVALLVQIYLSLNRLSAAEKEVNAAKKWAQDNIVFNLAESWVNLRTGGEKYTSAYYVFDELAQTSNTGTKSILGQGLSEILLGRIPEAVETLKLARERDGRNPDVLAASVVASLISGDVLSSDTYENSLREVAPSYPLLADLDIKSKEFDIAASKFKAKISA